ncbi:uncharacterized protein LOC141608299 [Silene latifolia]|uniref:uncharacterized protein LOC141608299 n=1 Tax=Silene latifolia TaxID=37657 RepID=UPI003D77EA7D
MNWVCDVVIPFAGVLAFSLILAFYDWRINTPLYELPYFGLQFTWANKRETSSLILKRLDRGYAPQDWLLTFPEAHIQNLNIFLSDHAPIVLDLSARIKKPKRPYRVDNWCLEHTEIQALVTSIWHSFSFGHIMSSVIKKLSQIRSGILNWVLHNRRLFMLDWSSISQELSKSASLIHDSSTGSDYLHNLKATEHDVRIQHSFWSQRAKSEFHFNDGLPTAYFYSRVKSRQKRLRIISLKDDTGSWTSSESDLSLLILDDLQRDFLSQPFTAIDVDNPENISQFRPISICNVIYRAASKCIALRLRRVTENIISQNQNAFLPGRLISDSGVLGHEILTYINQRRSGTRCFGAIKLDMNKAFDRVSWPFLFHVLKLFGFPKAFRQLIKSCVKTVSL